MCWEHEVTEFILTSTLLSEDFFELKTKSAGNFIQKFINHDIKAAVIVSNDNIQKIRFKEMAAEINKGNHFRLYENKEDAKKWLLK